MAVKEVLHDVETKMKKTVEATQRNFSSVRTGRASTALLDAVKVECYETMMPLKQLAAVTTPDARTVMIQPWDKGVLASIEKSLLKSDIGIMPANDGKVIRLVIPPLTQERRLELDKSLKKIAEDGHISVRSTRHAALEAIKKLKKDKLITEDDEFKGHEDVQKLTDKYIKEIDTILAAKEKDIQG